MSSYTSTYPPSRLPGFPISLFRPAFGSLSDKYSSYLMLRYLVRELETYRAEDPAAILGKCKKGTYAHIDLVVWA